MYSRSLLFILYINNMVEVFAHFTLYLFAYCFIPIFLCTMIWLFYIPGGHA